MDAGIEKKETTINIRDEAKIQSAELEDLIAESECRSTIKEAERQKRQLQKMLDKLNDKKVEEDN